MQIAIIITVCNFREVGRKPVADIKTPFELIVISDTEASPVKTDVVFPPCSSLMMMKNDPDVQPFPLESFTVLKTPMDGHCIISSLLLSLQHVQDRHVVIPTKNEIFLLIKHKILSHMEFYSEFINIQNSDFVAELERYHKTKSYSANIVDVVLIALANIFECTIVLLTKKVNELIMENRLRDFIYPARSKISKFRIAFKKTGEHYEPVVPRILLDAENSTFTVDISQSLDNHQDRHNELSRSSIDEESTRQSDGTGPSETSDTHTDSCADEYESGEEVVEYRGSKIYVNPRVFDKLKIKKVGQVPNNIDGICIFEVPIQDNLNNCEGGRPWGKQISSRSKLFKDGPRLLVTCRGSYMCRNTNCENIMDFGINMSDFTKRNDKTICSICESDAIFVPCNARIFIEKNVGEKINTVKHFGYHTCRPLLKGRPDKTEIEKILDVEPSLTRETIIRDGVKRKLMEDGYQSAIGEAKRYTDTKFVDNVKANTKRKLHPLGHSFPAVSALKESFDKEDKFLIYSLDDGSKKGFPYIVKSSQKKVELMMNMNRNGSHRLKETVLHLDVIHSRTKAYKAYSLSYYDATAKNGKIVHHGHNE